MQALEHWTVYVVCRRKNKRLCVKKEVYDPLLCKQCTECHEFVNNEKMLGWGKGDICRECAHRRRFSHMNSAQRWYHNQRRHACCSMCGFKGEREPKCLTSLLPGGLKREKHRRPLELAKHNQLDDLNVELRRGVWLCMSCHRQSRYHYTDDMGIEPEVETTSTSAEPEVKACCAGATRMGFDQQLYNEQSVIVREVQKMHKQCRDCSREVTDENWMIFDWDHVNPVTKSFSIGIEMGRVPTTQLLEEIQKCELRCANCHCIRTMRENHSELRRRGTDRNVDYFLRSLSASMSD